MSQPDPRIVALRQMIEDGRVPRDILPAIVDVLDFMSEALAQMRANTDAILQTINAPRD